jgi:DNA-binding transcriptional ArsR family regulator
MIKGKGKREKGKLAEPFATSPPAVFVHLKVLERAGLVSRGDRIDDQYRHDQRDDTVRPRRSGDKAVQRSAADANELRQRNGGGIQRAGGVAEPRMKPWNITERIATE